MDAALEYPVATAAAEARIPAVNIPLLPVEWPVASLAAEDATGSMTCRVPRSMHWALDMPGEPLASVSKIEQVRFKRAIE